MVKALKKRSTATVIAVIIVIAALFGGTRLSFARQANALRDMYSNGLPSSDGKYTHPSIASQIDISMDYALGLSTIATNYPDADVQSWRALLIDARESYITDDSKSISNAAGAYYATVDAAENLYEAMQRVDLTDRDAEAISAYHSDIIGAKTLITSLAAEYNAMVAVKEQATEAFPALIFCGDNSRLAIHQTAFYPTSDYAVG